jgi:hypothetical protein
MDDYNEKINMDDLYKRKNEIEQNKLRVFGKILQRVHTKIKVTSRQRHAEQFTFFVIPEFLVGVPRYDVAACTAYIIDKLQDNGFFVKYTHPNLLFISWAHYYDKTARMNIKNEYGVNIDGFGNVIKSKTNPFNEKKNSYNNNDSSNLNMLIFNKNNANEKKQKEKKDYKQISTYKPTGNLIYNTGLFKTIQDRTRD